MTSVQALSKLQDEKFNYKGDIIEHNNRDVYNKHDFLNFHYSNLFNNLPIHLKANMFNFIGDSELLNDINEFEAKYKQVRKQFKQIKYSNAIVKFYKTLQTSMNPKSYKTIYSRIRCEGNTHGDKQESDNMIKDLFNNENPARHIYKYLGSRTDFKHLTEELIKLESITWYSLETVFYEYFDFTSYKSEEEIFTNYDHKPKEIIINYVDSPYIDYEPKRIEVKDNFIDYEEGNENDYLRFC